MKKLNNINEMVKATLNEESMGSAGKSPIQVVSKEAGRKDFSEEEKKELMDMMKEMDMDEESDMDDFEKEVKECGSFEEMKKVVKKYMK